MEADLLHISLMDNAKGGLIEKNIIDAVKEITGLFLATVDELRDLHAWIQRDA